MAPMAGRVIAGRYILEELIGHGGMGRVWRAHDQLLNRKVALKEVLLPVLIDEDEAAAYQRTLREARTVARLNHPSIVTIYDVAEEDGRLWIVMELVPSGSLEERLAAHGPMTHCAPPDSASSCSAHSPPCTPRGAAQGREAEQRPDRPGRAGRRPDDRAVLTDFGIARSEGDLGSPGQCGDGFCRLHGAGATRRPRSDVRLRPLVPRRHALRGRRGPRAVPTRQPEQHTGRECA